MVNEMHGRKAPRQLVEDHSQFEPCERCAEAEVQPVPERDVLAGVAPRDVERLGGFEVRFVVIG